MSNPTIYNDGTYLASHPDWHIEDSPTKAQWIKSIIPEDLKRRVRSVLEIGCGRGAVLNELRSYFSKDCQFIGIDISNEAITYARNNFKDIEFICSDIFNMKSEERYDLILCIDVLEHVYCQDEFIKRVASISKYSIFHVPLGNNFKNKLLDRWKNQINKFGHVQFYDVGSLINFFTNSGLAIRDYRYMFGLEHPKFKYIYPFFLWAFKLSPYITSQTIGLVSILTLAESVSRDLFFRKRNKDC